MYYIEKFFVWAAVKLLTRFQLKGKENIPRRGAVLVVANHMSGAGDTAILGISFGRRVTFMAKEDLFCNWFVNQLLYHIGAFPVHRGGLNRDALRQAGEVLKKEKILVMFPEGRRSATANLQMGLPGSALIALQNKVPILPVGITGTETIRGWVWMSHRPIIVMKIGKPFWLNETDEKPNKERLEEFTDIIMNHIAELLPKQYQGKYAARED